MPTPAEELGSAANRLSQLTADATPGPWHAVAYDPSWAGDFDAGISTTPNGELDIAGHGYEGGGIEKLADAHYIAAMHPGVGAALAKWLDSWVGVDIDEYAAMPEDLTHALAVARAINSTTK